jgi:curved DNA-binding protein
MYFVVIDGHTKWVRHMASDYYKVLGVERNAKQEDIKRAFYKQAKRYHPDANRDDPKAEEKFKEVNEAYEVLGDPQKRQQYDQFGANWQNYQGFGGGQGGQYSNVDMGDMEDILQQIFGGGSPFGGSGRGSSPFGGSPFGGTRTRAPQSGQDIEQTINISLREAYDGTERIITKDGRRIRAKIPAGAYTGTKVRLAGEGGAGYNGGNNGDLYLIVNVESDSVYSRDGDDLYAEINVDMFTAMLGGDVQVNTMTRPIKLKIPAGTQSGERIRVRGKGMPIMRKKDQFGDLYVRVMITVPNIKDEQQRRMVESLRDQFQN